MLCSSARFSSLIQYIFGISIAMKAVKMIRRTKGHVDSKANSYGKAVRSSLLHYAPEILGLVGILAVALIIQTHGSMTAVSNAAEEKAITNVMRMWPTLLT